MPELPRDAEIREFATQAINTPEKVQYIIRDVYLTLRGQFATRGLMARWPHTPLPDDPRYEAWNKEWREQWEKVEATAWDFFVEEMSIRYGLRLKEGSDGE